MSADNPFVDDDGADPAIWSFGLRNPWKFSFDPVTESLWIADVGQKATNDSTTIDASSEPHAEEVVTLGSVEALVAIAAGADGELFAVSVTGAVHQLGASVR